MLSPHLQKSQRPQDRCAIRLQSWRPSLIAVPRQSSPVTLLEYLNRNFISLLDFVRLQYRDQLFPRILFAHAAIPAQPQC